MFAEKGVLGASVEEICDAAGFTRGAFYSNFDTKDELCLAVLERQASAQLEASHQAIASLTDADGAAWTASSAAPSPCSSTPSAGTGRPSWRWPSCGCTPSARSRFGPATVAFSERVSSEFVALIERTASVFGYRLTVPGTQAIAVLQGVYEQSAIASLLAGEQADAPDRAALLAGVLKSMLRSGLAGPHAEVEQHRPGDLDGEGDHGPRRPTPSARPRCGGVRRRSPTSVHSGNHNSTARHTDWNQYDSENASTWTPTQDASGHCRLASSTSTTTTPTIIETNSARKIRTQPGWSAYMPGWMDRHEFPTQSQGQVNARIQPVDLRREPGRPAAGLDVEVDGVGAQHQQRRHQPRQAAGGRPDGRRACGSAWTTASDRQRADEEQPGHPKRAGGRRAGAPRAPTCGAGRAPRPRRRPRRTATPCTARA